MEKTDEDVKKHTGEYLQRFQKTTYRKLSRNLQTENRETAIAYGNLHEKSTWNVPISWTNHDGRQHR